MSRRCILLLGSLWLTAIVIGTCLLLAYDYTAGEDAVAPPTWPKESRLPRLPGLHTLVMFAHPKCPCTRASLHELAVFMLECPRPVKAFVVFLQPPGVSVDWSQKDLWQSAEMIPGVSVVSDYGGLEAHYFRSTTSGHVVLYDAEERLQFSGGITGSRGHQGDNPGRSLLLVRLDNVKQPLQAMPIFGCSLLDPTPDDNEP